jgi:hypothetical protein
MKMKVLSVLILAGVFGNGMYLAPAVIKERTISSESRAELREQTRELDKVRHERRGFESLLKRLDLGGDSFLTGVDAAGDSVASFPSVPEGKLLLYVMDTRCSGSAVNIPALNDLHGSGMSVVAISFDDQVEDLSEFSRTHSIAFPVLGKPEGRSLDVLPRNGTPVTVLVSRDRVVSYLAGQINSNYVDALKGKPAQ